MASSVETVLVVGSTGNIGLSAILASLKAGRNVLAVVRNETSAQKIFDYIGSHNGITTVTADVIAHDGVSGVVAHVKAGRLPAFQHVFSCCGGYYADTPLKDITAEQIALAMETSFAPNLYAYVATVPYLLEQGSPDSTWTLCTGSQGDIAVRAAPAMSQGALYSMATAACRETADTHVRFNEMYTNLRVEVDKIAVQHGTMKSSAYANAYTLLLDDKSIKSARVVIDNLQDTKTLRHEPKIKA